MPYDPYAPDERARTNAYRWVPICGLFTLILIALKLTVGLDGHVSVIVGFSVGGVLATLWSYRIDEFFERLCLNGLRWMAAFIALFVFVISMASLPSIEARLGLLHARLNDGQLIGLLAMAAYYLGFAAAWLRERFS